MASHLHVSREQDSCQVGSKGGILLLQVAWQAARLSLQAKQSRASPHLRSQEPALWPAAGLPAARAEKCCPAGQHVASNASPAPCRRLPVQGCAATAARGWLLADSPGVLSLVGEGGLSWLWHSLSWPRLALCGQCLAALCSRSSGGGRPAAGAAAGRCAARSGLEQGQLSASGAATTAPCVL